MVTWTWMRLAGILALVAASPAAGSVWHVERTPNFTAPNGSLVAVSCASATACVAVGSHFDGNLKALAETWNGTAWHVRATPLPAGATGGQLSGVSCSAARACTAVGTYTDRAGATLALTERWNGSRWAARPVPVPRGAINAALSGVSCPSASACVAVGNYDNGSRPFADVWNGTRWALRAVPSPARSIDSSLRAVWCTAPRACTAVGGYFGKGFKSLTLAERWNGTRWRIELTPNPTGFSGGSLLSGVACGAASTCTAVGSSAIAGTGVNRTLAETWNGRGWRIEATRGPARASAQLAAISCASARACTAVGSSTMGSGTNAPLAERWNGTRWVIQPMPNPGAAILFGVSCPSRSDCAAVGDNFAGAGDVTLAQAWHGTSWRTQRTPSPVAADSSGLQGVSCGSVTACMAVGGYAAGGPFGQGTALAEKWDGARWSPQRLPVPAGTTESGLAAVSCTSPAACVAVGAYSTNLASTQPLAERWDGTRWTVLSTPSISMSEVVLTSVSCTSASACTAVGVQDNNPNIPLPLAERWDGTTWTIQSVPDPAGGLYGFLRGVSCSSDHDCVAVGDQGSLTASSVTLAERWDGTTWTTTPVPSPPGQDGQLFGVSCSSSAACTAIGQRVTKGSYFTLAERWDGTSWRIQVMPAVRGSQGTLLQGVSCSSLTACTTVGYNFVPAGIATLAEHWNGTRWTVQATPNPAGAGASRFFGVSCLSANACTAVGDNFIGQSTAVTLAESTF